MKRILVVFALVAVATSALAAPPFREDTVMVQKSSGLLGQKIETQIYSPPGDGST